MQGRRPVLQHPYAIFGGNARYVTALPKHALAEAAVDSVRSVGIDTQYILRTDKGRLGLYFWKRAPISVQVT